MDRRVGTEDRQRLASLAARVIAAPPEARAGIIAKIQTSDPGLSETLERLLLLDEDGSSSRDPLDDLGSLFRLAAAESEADDPFDQSGAVMGAYTLVRRIGAGAYGAVYLAEQVEPVRRRVALKLLHQGVGSPAVVRRFMLERRVLAAMEHPGIARFIDAGVAPDGRPYFVMELIEGADLLAYCRERGLGVDARVRLLAMVCDAVQHAHVRGIVHRDLKPGNVLVRELDGEPRPVVIDFGVARLLDPESDGSFTTVGQRVGTPRYMSPEQRAGKVVDARADVYALGVTVHDLLTVRCSTAEMPSGGELVLQARDGLTKALGWVVGKCCAEDPADRYQSVAELGADLRRYLGGEVVAAAPPSVVYRAGRFLARHAVFTTLAVVVLLLIVGFGARAQVANVMLHREIDAQQRLIEQTIEDVLDEIWVFTGSESVRERLIERLLSRVEQLLARRPNDPGLHKARARLLIALGYVYSDRSELDLMHKASERALEVYERLAASRPGDAEFMRRHAEAMIRMGDAINHRGAPETDSHEALTLYERAFTMQQAALEIDPDHIGLRDDLYWSNSRLRPFAPREAWPMWRERGLRLAESLYEASPDRLLSWHALQHAHLDVAHSLMYVDGRLSTDEAGLLEARRHADIALALSRRLAEVQPDRGGFLWGYISAIRGAIQLRRIGGSTDDLVGLIEELELLLKQTAPYSNRADLQQGHILGLESLAYSYTALGQHEKASDAVRQIAAFAHNPDRLMVPSMQRELQRVLDRIRERGLLSETQDTRGTPGG